MSEDELTTSDQNVGTSSESSDTEVNFQKKFSENVKLHPPAPDVVTSTNENTHLKRKNRPPKKTPYIGVFWNSKHKKWQMRTSIRTRLFVSRYFHSDVECAHEYDKFAREMVRRYSKQNFGDRGDIVTTAIEDKIAEDHKESKVIDNELSDAFGPSTSLDIETERAKALEEED